MNSSGPFDYVVLSAFVMMIAVGGSMLAAGLVARRRADDVTERVRAQWNRTLTRERILTPEVRPPEAAIEELIRAGRSLGAHSLIGDGTFLVIIQLIGLLLVRILWGRVVGAGDSAIVLFEALFVAAGSVSLAGFDALGRLRSEASPQVPRPVWALLLVPNAALWLVCLVLTIALQTRHLATRGENLDTQLALHSQPWLLWIYPLAGLLALIALVPLLQRVSKHAPDFSSDGELDERARQHWRSQRISAAAFASFLIAGLAGFQLALLDLSNRTLYWALYLCVGGYMLGYLYLQRRLRRQLWHG